MTFGVVGRYGAYLPIVAGLYLATLLKRPSPRAVDNNRIQLCINTRDPYLFQSQCVDCNRQLFPNTVQSCTGFQVPIQRYPVIVPNGQGGNSFPNGPLNIQRGQGTVPVNFNPGGYYIQQQSGQPQFNTGQLQRYNSPNSKTGFNSRPTEYSGQTGKIQPSTFQEGQVGSTQSQVQQQQGPTEYSGQTGKIQPSTFQEGQVGSTQSQVQQQQGPTEYSGKSGKIQPSTFQEEQAGSFQGQAQEQQGPTEYSGQTGKIQPSYGNPGNGGHIQNVPYPSPGSRQQQVKYVPRIQAQYRPVQQVIRRVVPQPQYTIRGKREAEEFFRAYDYEMEKMIMSERKSQARNLKLLFDRVISRTLKRIPPHKYLKGRNHVVGTPFKTFRVNMVLDDNRATFDL